MGTLNGLDTICDGKITHYRFPGEWYETKIRALLPTREGDLWVGTVQGVARMRDGQRVNYVSAQRWGGQEVRALFEDRTGRIWIGTGGAGLWCLQNERLSALTTTDGLSSDFVWALHEDADGVLWIGTQRGLNRLENKRVTAFTATQGVPETVVNCIVEDDLGCLWIGHDRGIRRMRRQDLNDVAAGTAQSVVCANYDEHDGLLSVEINGQKSQPSAIKTRDGRLWFATTKGVAIFDPPHLPDTTNALQVVIEQIRANGQIVFENGPEGASSTNTSSRFDVGNMSFHLPPGGADVLDVSYTACVFVGPDKVQFKHRLGGVDRDWIDAGPRRRATYLNLRPGHYRFEVIAADKYGARSAVLTGFAFWLAPHFWQTTWFYSVGLLGLAGAVCGVYRWRVAELRKHQKLERESALLRERERLAKDLHDGLGGSLTRLTLLADLADDVAPDAPDLQSRFQKVSRSTREALHAVRDIIWSAQPAYDTLESLALRLCDYAEHLCGTGEIRCRLHLPTPLPARWLSQDHRREVLFAAKEALHNVVKHSAASELRVRVEVDGAGFTIEIADNGRGFTAPPPTSDLRPPASGLAVHGLRTMRERIEGLGGRFSIDSQPGRGTTVRLWVPLETPPAK